MSLCTTCHSLQRAASLALVIWNLASSLFLAYLCLGVLSPLRFVYILLCQPGALHSKSNWVPSCMKPSLFVGPRLCSQQLGEYGNIESQAVQSRSLRSRHRSWYLECVPREPDAGRQWGTFPLRKLISLEDENLQGRLHYSPWIFNIRNAYYPGVETSPCVSSVQCLGVVRVTPFFW